MAPDTLDPNGEILPPKSKEEKALCSTRKIALLDLLSGTSPSQLAEFPTWPTTGPPHIEKTSVQGWTWIVEAFPLPPT